MIEFYEQVKKHIHIGKKLLKIEKPFVYNYDYKYWSIGFGKEFDTFCMNKYNILFGANIYSFGKSYIEVTNFNYNSSVYKIENFKSSILLDKGFNLFCLMDSNQLFNFNKHIHFIEKSFLKIVTTDHNDLIVNCEKNNVIHSVLYKCEYCYRL